MRTQMATDPWQSVEIWIYLVGNTQRDMREINTETRERTWKHGNQIVTIARIQRREPRER